MKLKDKIMLKHTDKLLLVISILLFSIGLIMIFSSSNIAAFMRYNTTPYNFLLKQGSTLILGFVLFMIVIQFNTKTYSALSWLALIVFFLILLFVSFFGPIINDARSWIRIAGITFQPSEFIKVILIVWYAAFFEFKRHELNKYSTSIFPLGVSAVISAVIILQPDFGTAGIIMILSYMLYILMPVKRFIKFRVVAVSVFLAVFLLLGYYFYDTSSFKRQTDRFDFQNPCSEEKFYTTGNQVCNSYIAFNNGGMWGKGLGNSTQKYLYLPESHTDFIFAVVVEELGFFQSSLIIIGYFILLWRIIYIGNKSSSSRGSIICYGVAIYIFLHMTINLLGIMGLLPLTGVPLPFLSYGGSFGLSLILALSMVQRVAIETRLKKLEKTE